MSVEPDVESVAPLSGIRVLDLTRVLSGPRHLHPGGLGADVIKIEELGDGDHVRTLPPFYPGRQSHYFVAFNRKSEASQ